MDSEPICQSVKTPKKAECTGLKTDDGKWHFYRGPFNRTVEYLPCHIWRSLPRSVATPLHLTRQTPNSGSIPGQRLRRWPGIEPELGERSELAGRYNARDVSSPRCVIRAWKRTLPDLWCVLYDLPRNMDPLKTKAGTHLTYEIGKKKRAGFQFTGLWVWPTRLDHPCYLKHSLLLFRPTSGWLLLIKFLSLIGHQIWSRIMPRQTKAKMQCMNTCKK